MSLPRYTAIPALLCSAVALFPTQLAAQGLPVDTGSHLPVALWMGGAFLLGLAILYGILRNRSRSSAEKRLTEQATRENYRREGDGQ